MTKAQSKFLELVHFADVKKMLPSAWAETYRVMTTEVSNFPGKFSFDRAPWAREIIDHFDDSSPARKIAIMKGAQIGASTSILENVIGWTIAQDPCNILLASGDEALLKEQFESKIDNMIDNAGLRDLLRPNATKKRNSRTGDTEKSKEFAGGRLYGRSVQNAKKWKQTSFKKGLVDDFEAADRTDGREGNVANLIIQRFASYGSTYKLAFISTPGIKRISNIEPLYEQGDQRRYKVPCPCCGDYIPLEFQLKGEDGSYYGIVWDADENGQLIEGSVRYRCQSCGDTFEEAGNKAEILKLGRWEPTAEPSEPGFYSYHISALYAAPGMFDWTHYARQFIKASKTGDTGELMVFNNLVLGKTWEERGNSPRSTRIAQNTRSYPVGTVPNALSIQDGNGPIVMLTCACDLNGLDTERGDARDDARLDYEILAHAQSGATYSVDAGSIGTFQRRLKTDERELWSYKFGHVNCVWVHFEAIVTQTYLTDDDQQIEIGIVGVDTGAHTKHAYDFVNWSNAIWCVGLKGDNEASVAKLTTDTALFKPSAERPGLYNVQTNKIKTELARLMKLEQLPGQPQPPGFMNFPEPAAGKYTQKGYFTEFEGEQKLTDLNKSGTAIAYKWVKRSSSSRNHFWDCRVYNMVLRDVLSYEYLKEAGIKYPTWAQFCELMIN